MTEAELLEEATRMADEEYPMREGMETTERTVRWVLREGFVKGYMKGKTA
jgi:hypothetical protein